MIGFEALYICSTAGLQLLSSAISLLLSPRCLKSEILAFASFGPIDFIAHKHTRELFRPTESTCLLSPMDHIARHD